MLFELRTNIEPRIQSQLFSLAFNERQIHFHELMQNQFSKNNRESFDRTTQLEIDRKQIKKLYSHKNIYRID